MVGRGRGSDFSLSGTPYPGAGLASSGLASGHMWAAQESRGRRVQRCAAWPRGLCVDPSAAFGAVPVVAIRARVAMRAWRHGRRWSLPHGHCSCYQRACYSCYQRVLLRIVRAGCTAWPRGSHQCVLCHQRLCVYLYMRVRCMCCWRAWHARMRCSGARTGHGVAVILPTLGIRA